MRLKKSIRKYHRYLGLIIGIQFLFWTLGGLYFSWTNIEGIRGNTLKKPNLNFSKEIQIPDIGEHLTQLNLSESIDSIKGIRLSQILDQAVIQLNYYTSKNDIVIEERAFIDLKTNEIINEIIPEMAGEIAQNSMLNPVEILEIRRIEKVDINSHHEYRNGIFPAFVVQMNSKNNLRIYIDAKSGEVLKYRTQNWRIFDFLWMMHTMDYEGRDNLNNWVLRAFSILGLLTILSGFILFVYTEKWFRKKRSI